MSSSRSTLLFRWRCPYCSRRSPSSRSLPIRTLATTSRRKDGEPLPDAPKKPATDYAPPVTPQRIAPTLGSNPHSPRYIRVPQSFQPIVEKKQWIKGFLPKPRDIFHEKHGGLGRASPRRLRRIYPKSRKPIAKTQTQAQADLNAYRARMASMRRDNMQSGLKALRRRRETRDATSAAKQGRRAEERKELITSSPAEDDRLTRMSQTKEMTAPLQHQGPHMTDPNAAERHAAKVGRYQAQQARKAADTQDALHTLYMRAQDFIITEEHLDREIDKAFGRPEDPAVFAGKPSIWARGAPPSLQSMLDATGQASGGTLSPQSIQAREKLTEQRLKKVAERLTGGKM